MQVSLEWLNEYIDLSNISPEQIAHELTMSGLEVEEVEHTGAKFTNVIVGEIKEIKGHPNADKLHLVQIFNGKEIKEVVCGAQNIEEGQIIPYASVGSAVLDRKTGETFVLKPAKIRGVESQGMLCSAEELGLKTSDYQNDDGILILNRFLKDLTVGMDAKDALNINEDIVFHVAPTANRGDQMSVIGIARELSSIFNKELKYPTTKNNDIATANDFNVKIKNDFACHYYAAGILNDITIQQSPDWMQKRLLSSGVRSINNVVDITNYVMLEYGQPLHAFDKDKLNDNCLCVQQAVKGDKIVTLDENERVLVEESVTISTSKEHVALAGVMGGFNSEVDNNTKNIVLESAYFSPVSNRKSSRSIGLRTEACARFERGIDIEQVKPALIRAIDLMQELANAKISGIAETGNNKLDDIEVTLRFSQVTKILGIEIPNDICIQILEKLGFKELGSNGFSAKFLVPSYRVNDVTREIDLIEEIGRIHGYDKIEPTLPAKTVPSELSEEIQIINQIHNLFLGNGFNEAITSSLIGEPLLSWIGIDYNKEQAVKVTNPQSDDYTMLRQNLIPSIAHVVKYNLSQGQKNVWIYEIGKVFHFNSTPDEKSSGVEENRYIAGAITGCINSGKWHLSEEPDFYTLKGIIESIFKLVKLDNRIEYAPLSDTSYLHPGRAAEIKLLGKNKVSLGKFGEINPNTKEKCKISQPLYIFELNLDAILANMNHSTVKFKQLSAYPAVTRDIAFIIPQANTHLEITKAIKKSSSNLLKDIEIFDVYQGEHIPEGAKSVAYRLTLQDTSSTLTDEKIDSEIVKVRAGLKKAFPEINYRE